jgi:predicted metal-dependent phosphotriesterase family hydrolase
MFLPRLRQAGLDERTIRTLTVDNPFRAFAR